MSTSTKLPHLTIITVKGEPDEIKGDRNWDRIYDRIWHNCLIDGFTPFKPIKVTAREIYEDRRLKELVLYLNGSHSIYPAVVYRDNKEEMIISTMGDLMPKDV